MADGLSLAWCSGPGGNRCAPRLCVYLHPSENHLSRRAHQLLDTCLEKVPAAPERKDFFQGGNPGKYREDVKHSDILQELHGDGCFKDADYTALGWLQWGSQELQAVGLASNLKRRDRAFSVAMSLTILLELEEQDHPGPGCVACILNNFGQPLRQLLNQAPGRRSMEGWDWKTWPLENSQTLQEVCWSLGPFYFGWCLDPLFPWCLATWPRGPLIILSFGVWSPGPLVLCSLCLLLLVCLFRFSLSLASSSTCTS